MTFHLQQLFGLRCFCCVLIVMNSYWSATTMILFEIQSLQPQLCRGRSSAPLILIFLSAWDCLQPRNYYWWSPNAASGLLSTAPSNLWWTVAAFPFPWVIVRFHIVELRHWFSEHLPMLCVLHHKECQKRYTSEPFSPCTFSLCDQRYSRRAYPSTTPYFWPEAGTFDLPNVKALSSSNSPV